jgi:hypothetical protein
MLNRKKTDRLVNLLRKQMLYQTATPILNGDKVVRVNVTMHAAAYAEIMQTITEAGGWVMPEEDREKLLASFAEKAKTVGGGYDLTGWSAGELAAALDDTLGIEQLAGFSSAVAAEIKRRALS